MAEQMKPIRMGPRPLTKPAAGAMPTKPQIMPLRAPRKVGFFSELRNMSMKIQVSMATAVATLVLTTAAEASAPAKYGSPAVKPFPPQPQDARTGRDEDEVVRYRPFPVAGQPGPDDRGGDKARGAGGQVDDVPTGEVERALAGPVTATPDHEGVDRVGERDPQRYEDAPDLEADPAEHAADEQDGRDPGEHKLEIDQ